MKLATLCYVIDKDKTLMIYRNKKKDDYHQGKWNGIGGKFEQGESPEECAKREVLEETGLTTEKLNYKGFITFPLFDDKDDWYVHVFIITKFSGKLIDSPEGDLKWIPTEEIKNLNLWEGDRIFLDWLWKEKFFSAKFYYKEGSLEKYDVEFY